VATPGSLCLVPYYEGKKIFYLAYILRKLYILLELCNGSILYQFCPLLLLHICIGNFLYVEYPAVKSWLRHWCSPNDIQWKEESSDRSSGAYQRASKGLEDHGHRMIRYGEQLSGPFMKIRSRQWSRPTIWYPTRWYGEQHWTSTADHPVKRAQCQRVKIQRLAEEYTPGDDTMWYLGSFVDVLKN
jgi:hypothetical protein